MTELAINYIKNTDCFIEAENLPEDSIDHIVSDIPYNINYQNAEWDRDFDVDTLAKESYRVLKKNGNCIIFTGWSKIREVWNTFEENGFILNNSIVWDRQKGRGAKHNLVSTKEEILWFVKDCNTDLTFNRTYSTIKKKTKGMGSKNGSEFRVLSNVWSDISPVAPMSKEYLGNKCQKPLKLMERILEVFTNKTDLVLDWTIGSGATIEACIKLDRTYIGFEKEKDTFNLALDRINTSLLISYKNSWKNLIEKMNEENIKNINTLNAIL